MPATDVLEQDEAVVEQGLVNGALEFLRDAVLKSSAFYGKERVETERRNFMGSLIAVQNNLDISTVVLGYTLVCLQVC